MIRLPFCIPKAENLKRKPWPLAGEVYKMQDSFPRTNKKRIHVAIMKSEWNLTQKILNGEKKIESRWYKNRYRPWNRISKGDVIYFKNSGKPVTAKAKVAKVEQYSNLDEKKTKQLFKKYSSKDLGITKIIEEVKEYIANKNYCIFITLKNPQPVESFEIDKTGYGAMASWLIVDEIEEIKTES